MTPDEENALVSMARPLGATNASRDAIRLAIRAAVAAERERCASCADAEASIEGIAQRIAAAIRKGE